jgi:sigma-E factor negative regulatory protein RseC
MKKNDSISHLGKIVSMTPQTTTVVFLQHGACSQCHAAGLCGMADMSEKTLQVPTDPYAGYKVGDEVQVLLKASMGMKAVWLAYFIPLVVMLSVILGLIGLDVPEIPAALSGLGVLGLYYLGLWLFRDKLQNEYICTIKPQL